MEKASRSITQDLQYIKSSNPRVDLNLFPDFLIIGPHRSGTTWLYRNLSGHPQILFPSQKEPHFFCEHESLRPLACRLSDNDLSSYLSLFRKIRREYLTKTIEMWRKYRELYRPKVKGEATACYAVLEKKIIREIFTLNPKLKVVLMIRNPVDRAWSHAIHYFVKQQHRQLSEIPDEELNTFFQSKHLLDAGQYTKIIETWSSYTTENGLFIGFFDDIQKSPEELLLNLFTFLGVCNNPKYIGEDVQKKINKSVTSIEIPERFKIMLINMFKDEIERLRQTFNISWKVEG